MVKTFIFIALYVGALAELRAQDLENMNAHPSKQVLQPVLVQKIDRPIEVIGPLHLAKHNGIVVISINCFGDSSGTGPIIGGGRGDQVITYIDGIPVRGGGAVVLVYAEEKWLPGVPAEYEYIEPERWKW